MKMKNMTAIVLALVTIATSAVGLNANAAEITSPVIPGIVDEYSGTTGTAYFGTGGVATIYLDPTKGTAGTQRNVSTYKLHAEITQVWGDTVTGTWSTTVHNQTYCSVCLTANHNSLNKITTYHYYKPSGGSQQSISLVRTCTV